MKSLIPEEQAVVDNQWNVLLSGPHGIGKSESVRGFADRHGLSWAMFNCATMDPYTDLVGVPMPRTNDSGREVLRMIRPDAIDTAEVLFFDEINRGGPEIHNALLEILNERSLNGEPLPNLKCVFGAINPPGDDHGYQVQSLDPAFTDRFHIHVDLKAVPSIEYLTQLFDKKVARALVAWWKDADHARRDSYISPRRLVHLGKTYLATGSQDLIDLSIPSGMVADTGKLFLLLEEATGKVVARSENDSKLASTEGEPTPADKAASVGGRSGAPSWILVAHASDPQRMTWAGKHTVNDLKTVLGAWSQPSQSRFRRSLEKIYREASAEKREEWQNVVDAINAYCGPKSRIRV